MAENEVFAFPDPERVTCIFCDAEIPAGDWWCMKCDEANEQEKWDLFTSPAGGKTEAPKVFWLKRKAVPPSS